MDRATEFLTVSAINKYKGEYTIHNLDEATDYLSYDEIIDCVLKFYIESFRSCPNSIQPSFDFLRSYIEHFYKLDQKTIDEVLDYDPLYEVLNND